ncbi:Protein of unknown function DUF159 [Penicillium griseofulvum]|uniref:DUF159 domain protein n=1 Tax=Penicillium patulum TaxID=5078 RepID=A0A135LVW8_PENPA|nr:Protein of unknown function DUF159 [Penicillium griseofulvum]KXG53107.1 Protein of unknown function DUF159 [Penicillium griseofulvum]
MCGRYALGVRLAYIRQRMQEQGMQVDEAPDDDAVRETYNFAPGNFGVVYRADITEKRSYDAQQDAESEHPNKGLEKGKDDVGSDVNPADKDNTVIKYKLQSMKWGLIPFWTKRQPDYGSMMRTINCRDDSLIEDSGMWTTMKRRKRCIVICQGFYEWLKKGPGGKDKVPHFVRRKDGGLMCFAGLWDCSDEKLYTYTVITTSSNSYLKFLHERMPVILDPGSEAMNKWLDPARNTWSKELQSILKPYEGELECYPVPKEVGKVGNNSPNFIVPVDSKENKSNIANFFANVKTKEDQDPSLKKEMTSPKVKMVKDEDRRPTIDSESTEDNAPKPGPAVKREHSTEASDTTEETKKRKVNSDSTGPSPQKKKLRSATHNSPMKKSSGAKATDGSQRITSFFKK